MCLKIKTLRFTFSLLLLTAFSLLFSGITTNAFAGNQFVGCVQASLNELQFSAGVADGLIGGNTKKALKEYQSKFNPPDAMKGLTTGNAVQWCNLIVKNHPELKDKVRSIAVENGYHSVISMLQEPPAGAVLGHFQSTKPGTIFVTNGKGKDGGPVWYVPIKQPKYKGRDVWRLSNGWETDIYDARTLNKIAIFRGGKLFASRTPDEGRFVWPLWEGRKWIAEYISKTPRGRKKKIQDKWEITSYEKIEIGSGTFDVFKMVQTATKTSPHETTIWYSPDIGYYARKITKPILYKDPPTDWTIDRIISPDEQGTMQDKLARAYHDGKIVNDKNAFVGNWEWRATTKNPVKFEFSRIDSQGNPVGTFKYKNVVIAINKKGKKRASAKFVKNSEFGFRMEVIMPDKSAYDLVRTGDKMVGSFYHKARKTYTATYFTQVN